MPAFGPLLNLEHKLTYTRFPPYVAKTGFLYTPFAGPITIRARKIVAIAANGTAARRSRRLLSAQLVHGGIAAFFESSADPL